MNTPTRPNIFSRRELLLRGGAALLLPTALAASGALRAQTAPPAVLRILCTAPPGTIPDIIARRYAEQLSPGHPGGVIVDNRPGAAGRIAVAALKQAPPDGTTLLLAQAAVATVYPYLYDKLAYDPTTDLMPVSSAAEASLGLAVGPLVPAALATLPQLADWLRANPALASYGSPGMGTLPHLMVALYGRDAGLALTHVPYAGGPQMLQELMAGRLALLALPEGLLRPLLAAGKLRVLATSGPARSSFLPGVAGVAEQGFPNLVMREWFAFFAPGATAAPQVEQASAAIRQAAGQPALQRALADAGMTAVASNVAELRARIAAEQPLWRDIVARTGVRVE